MSEKKRGFGMAYEEREGVENVDEIWLSRNYANIVEKVK